MDKSQKFAAGIASVIAVGMLTFVPASADSTEKNARVTNAPSAAFMAELNSSETPQHLVWDMTYGDLQPPVALEATEVARADSDEATVDLSMG
jgi:hypothetical protein